MPAALAFESPAVLPPAPADPVGVARRLVPLLAQHAEAAERDRRASKVVIQALRDAGLTKMMFSRRAGGPGQASNLTLLPDIRAAA